MKEAKHFLKVTTLVLYATFLSLTPAIVCAADRLNPGELLRAETEQQITSANGQYRLIMQKDGNLVLYDDARRQLLWESNTRGQRVDRVIMQRDGNLVLYLHSGQPAWASNTAGKPGSFLLVQNDGNMVIYRPQGVWASNTADSQSTLSPAVPNPIPPPEMQKTEKPAVTYLITTKNDCNVRSQPNGKSKRITTLNRGQKLQKISQFENWHNIILPSGKKGWIHKDLVKNVD